MQCEGTLEDHQESGKKLYRYAKPEHTHAVAAFTRRFMVICDCSCDRQTLKERIDPDDSNV
jgi:hypothetical protein